jgi:hypothetical protein
MMDAASKPKQRRFYLDYLLSLADRRSEPAPDIADQAYWDRRRLDEAAKDAVLRGDR